ncbi:MAG: SirA-like protein [Peptococcaceae bacterium]|jgi:TusA-related sulfurtransferase|uniref:SirA family protein n=1 Tax=Thermanaerosceptrum fracticalcis TaxID=1712410 RepID=A0A7G6E3V2_THEFR|nr:sulfurtransferase TusA family protein [Thermanaerosceptrum fracticalcis]MBZ4654062.1 SirA-like protein [Peptococcaceae bacterium]QNB46756.1 SirA family protein [Thermanaerosceptrum fracticalcis]
MAEYLINARGLQCPGPIVQLFNQSKQCAEGDVIKIEVTDPGFKRDVQAWCKKTGNELIDITEKDGVIIATIKKN